MSAVPRVTVLIPVYNRERYVRLAIDSVLAQTYRDFELLVIDDGSIDASREVVQACGDPRVRLVCNPQNLGQPRTRNRGLELARGEYVAMLDSDDYAYPDRLAIQVDFLDRHPEYAEVGAWNTTMDADGRPRGDVKWRPSAAADVDAQLLFDCCLTHGAITGRTAILREYRYREDFLRCQDYDLHVRLARRHKLGNVPYVLLASRRHGEQFTRGTHDLGEEKKLDILRGQIEELGLEYTRGDLERHRAIPRLRSRPAAVFGATAPGLAADCAAFLDWAESWLQGLETANRRARRYEEAALRRIVRFMWAKACLDTAPLLGPRALVVWVRSELRSGLVAAVTGAAVRRGPDWMRARWRVRKAPAVRR